MWKLEFHDRHGNIRIIRYFDAPNFKVANLLANELIRDFCNKHKYQLNYVKTDFGTNYARYDVHSRSEHFVLRLETEA